MTYIAKSLFCALALGASSSLASPCRNGNTSGAEISLTASSQSSSTQVAVSIVAAAKSSSSSTSTKAKSATSSKAAAKASSSASTKAKSTTSNKAAASSSSSQAQATQAASASSSSDSRTTAPSGCITVSNSTSTGQYSSLSSAVASLSGSDDACIFMYGGTYEEQVVIDYAGALTIYGYTTDTSSYKNNEVTITHTITSTEAGTLDKSSTLDITSSNFAMYNINVANGYGKGSQAVAVTANGDSQGFYGCSFDGYQDTLYAKAGTQYYSQCYIAGAVDYIFGDAAAWFEGCTVASKGEGAITANSREEESDTNWYIFNNCTITTADDATGDLTSEVYLGRPWRVLARVMYQYCSLSDIINAAGWTTMADGATPVYEEYENTGDGSSTSDREYESTASGAVTMDTLFTDGYDWIDSSYPAVSSSASAEVVTSSVKASTTVAASKSTSTSAKTSKTTTSSATSSTKSNVSGSSDASESVCTPTAGGSSSVDDTPAIESAIAACPSGTILIPAGKTYYINSALSFDGCAGCTLQLEGTLMASDDTDYWNGVGAMITLESIDSATIISETGTGVFDGNGQASWDLFATDSSYDRPTMLLITKSSNVIVENIYFKDAPNVFHSCNGDSTEVAYNNITLYAVSSSDDVTAKNTDGWDIGPATYVTIQGATVTNDDDCVAFKPGASYVSVYDITCTGSHGLSVGSLGSKAGTTDTVENIYVSGATMISSSKAAGIKVYPGGYGSAVVSNVTWENVVVKDCDYAFQVQSCYGEDDDYCDDNPSDAQISGVVVSGLSGTTSGSYAPAAINIDCPADGTCGITMTDVTVEADGGDTEYLCANTSSDIGITCTDGASG